MLLVWACPQLRCAMPGPGSTRPPKERPPLARAEKGTVTAIRPPTPRLRRGEVTIPNALFPACRRTPVRRLPPPGCAALARSKGPSAVCF
jgi:hypothetical protein